MNTSFELFGAECDSGWYQLILPIIEYINEYNANIDKQGNKDNTESISPKIVFTQIKEKWGKLDISLNFGTAELWDMIEKAEEDSYNVCEICGSRDDVGCKESEWIKTICHKCAKERAPLLWRSNNTEKLYHIDADGEETEITEDENAREKII